MSIQTRNGTATKRTFWTIAIFYLLIGFEFFYMASPFAIYFYSVYGPGLNSVNSNPTLAWLSSVSAASHESVARCCASRAALWAA